MGRRLTDVLIIIFCSWLSIRIAAPTVAKFKKKWESELFPPGSYPILTMLAALILYFAIFSRATFYKKYRWYGIAILCSGILFAGLFVLRLDIH